jgi:hypothetical protein
MGLDGVFRVAVLAFPSCESRAQLPATAQVSWRNRRKQKQQQLQFRLLLLRKRGGSCCLQPRTACRYQHWPDWRL